MSGKPVTSAGTLTKFTTVLKHTRTFLQWKFQENDIDIRRLDHELITDLEFWYKSVARCDHNTTMKYIACVRKMTIPCLRNGWLSKDPFAGFNMELREKPREALMDEELQTPSWSGTPVIPSVSSRIKCCPS